ncbi:class I SAM-dependent methyltransferase [Streptomyces sp. NPDC003758]
MLPPVDYSRRLFAGYARGRALTERTAAVWRAAFTRHAPPERPLTVLDLGCGVGRFTPLLAELFGGPVYGVEPADRMRAVAETDNAHPAVTFLAGDAGAVPLGTDTCDLALLFLVFQHVPDRAAATAELARVLRPGGRVLLQSSFSGRLEERTWFRYFPRAREVEDAMFPTYEEVVAVFTAAGFALDGVDRVECEVAPSLAAYADKLRHRAVPTFEYLDEDEIRAGFAALDADVTRAGDTGPVREPADLMVFRPA